MTIETKIRKIGNSLGIILPKEALQQLNGKEGQAVYLTEGSEGSVNINPNSPDFQEIMKMAEEGMDQYRNALKELAK